MRRWRGGITIIMDEEQLAEVVGASADTPTGTPETELAQARAEAEKNLNGWKRALADFENYQKRKEAENKDLIEFAREVVVAKLLPSLDTIQQALLHTPTDLSKMEEWKNGISGTLANLDKVL